MSEPLVQLIRDLAVDAHRARALPPFHEDAFEEARKVYEDTYRRSFARSRDKDEEAHHDAVGNALEAFLGTYLELITL